MPSIAYSNSVTSSTSFDLGAPPTYAPGATALVEAYLTVSATVTCAVEQPLASGVSLATVDTTFTGPCKKLVTLQRGRSVKLSINAVAQFTVELAW